MGNMLSKSSVSYHSPTQDDWDVYDKSINAFKSFEVPKIFDEQNKHDYLFIALADGTENDMKDPSRYTNVAVLRKELEDTNKNPHIFFDYIEGVGTYEGESNLLDKARAKIDAAFSLTHEQRVEKLYQNFSKQANIWKSKDPDANISIVEVGFSRGAGVATLLNQMVHERGIKDTTNRVWKDGKKELTGDYLISPGQVPQAVLLYDPVTTYMKENFSLSNSTVSALQINAKDEYRNLFPLSEIAEGKHQTQLSLPGCHSDIGGGYDKNGLSLYSRNIGNQYLNKMINTKEPLFKDTKLPSKNDPSVVIHHSEEHNVIYTKEKQRGITSMDKKEYQSKTASKNISEYNRSKLTYRPMVSQKTIASFKEQKVKASNNKHRSFSKSQVSIER
ncbi:MAG: DUF2235 domain-containing protein [Campylobacterales bacterium]|nr:DUF2235 domain-containing protein [Campylobacterales bacterium]